MLRRNHSCNGGEKSKGRILEGPEKSGFSIRLPKRKIVIFSTIVICCSILMVLTLCELVLRYRDRSGQGPDLLDPGLIRYDKALGWKLRPRWQSNSLAPGLSSQLPNQ